MNESAVEVSKDWMSFTLRGSGQSWMVLTLAGSIVKPIGDKM